MFEEHASILVNTVNCVGVMGAGVALAFKKKYPEMYKEYRALCDKGELRPGKPHIWEQQLLNTLIVNLPTKEDWRNPSKLEYIQLGLDFLYSFLKERGAVKVALPALGCGHGGLDFSVVSKMIEDKLGKLEAEIILFSPECSRQLPKKKKNSDINFEELKKKGVNTFLPHTLPFLEGAIKDTVVYSRGSIFKDYPQGVALISSYKPSNVEQIAFKKIVQQLLEKNIIMTVGYSPTLERPALKYILENYGAGIVLYSEGINRFSIRKDIERSWSDERISVVSISSPDERWKNYNTSKLRLFSILSTKATIVTDSNPEWLLSISDSIFHSNNVFFVNYEQESDDLKQALVAKGVKVLGPKSGTYEPDLTFVYDLVCNE